MLSEKLKGKRDRLVVGINAYWLNFCFPNVTHWWIYRRLVRKLAKNKITVRRWCSSFRKKMFSNYISRSWTRVHVAVTAAGSEQTTNGHYAPIESIWDSLERMLWKYNENSEDKDERQKLISSLIMSRIDKNMYPRQSLRRKTRLERIVLIGCIGFSVIQRIRERYRWFNAHTRNGYQKHLSLQNVS